MTKTCQALVRNIWNVRAALLESLEKFFEKLDITSSAKAVSEDSIVLILDSLLEGSLRDFKYVGLRNQGLELLKNFIAKLKGNVVGLNDALELSECTQKMNRMYVTRN